MTNKTPVDNIIELRNVYKEYDGKQVVKNASLTIKRGEFVTLLGPSGCGKTTTLRMIAGFEMPTSGKIIFNGKDITDTPPHLRPVNTVFQKYALFPHLNVFNNIAFGLKLKVIPNGTKVNKKGETIQLFRKYTKAEIKEKVNNALKMVDSKITDTETYPRSAADNNNASQSLARSSTNPKCCFSTSLWARSTSKCARICNSNLWICTKDLA